MNAYWDSSALIAACSNVVLRDRLHHERGMTGSHALAEVFSTLTGGKLACRLDGDTAAQTVANLAKDLDFCDLSPSDILKALREARRKGVRGGRVHDYLHAVAAEKYRVERLLTLDKFDFDSLTEIEVGQL